MIQSLVKQLVVRKMARKETLLFLLLVLATQILAQCNIAANLANGRVLTYMSTYRSCLEAVPLNDTMRKNVLDTAQALVKLYSFADLAKNSAASGSDYSIQVNLENELAALATKTYPNDVSFQQDVVTIFNRLYDAHTVYTPPAPYKVQNSFFHHSNTI